MCSSICADRFPALPAIRWRSTLWACCCRSMCSWCSISSLPPVRWIPWRSWHQARLSHSGLELWLRQARSKTIAYLAARFDAVVSVRALASVLNLPLAMTERAPIASQLSRFRQFEIGRELFAGNFASALFDLPFTLLFVILLFLIGGLLGFVPIGLSIVIVIVCMLSCHRQRGADHQGERQQTQVGRAVVRADGQAEDHQKRLGGERFGWRATPIALRPISARVFDNLQLGSHLQSTTNALVALAGIVTLAVGALRVMNDAMSLGELIAAMMIVWRVLVPIQIVSLNIARLKQTLSTVRQINELVRMGVERESEVPPTLSRRLDGDIFASGVYLSLGAQQEPPLRGVNLEVKAGEIVAITGPSGSGKSTLLKVILGLYPQYMGTVRLGGLDLRQLHPAEARTAIGYASQQLAFFYGSIAANFRFACPERHRCRHHRGAGRGRSVVAQSCSSRRLGDADQRNERAVAFAGLAVPPLDCSRTGQEARHPPAR